METQKAIDMFLASKKVAGLSELTLQYYAGRLNRFARIYPELPYDAFKIETFIGTVKGVPETKHGYYLTLRVFYNYLERRFNIASPMQYVQPPRLHRKVMATLEAADIDLLLLIIEGKPLKDKALVTLILDTGIRTGEAVNLKACDIHGGYIVVDGKTGQRRVPISEDTQVLLNQLAALTRGYLFGIKRNRAYQIIRHCLHQIGLEGAKLGGHRLRHSFGRHYLVNGGDVRSLQRILGHSNINTTEKYAALADADIAQKHRQFTPLARVHRGDNVPVQKGTIQD